MFQLCSRSVLFTAQCLLTGQGAAGDDGGGGGRKCSRELNIVKTVSTTVQLSTKLNMEGAFLYLTVYTYLYISTRAKETTHFWQNINLFWSESQLLKLKMNYKLSSQGTSQQILQILTRGISSKPKSTFNIEINFMLKFKGWAQGCVFFLLLFT